MLTKKNLFLFVFNFRYPRIPSIYTIYFHIHLKSNVIYIFLLFFEKRKKPNKNLMIKTKELKTLTESLSMGKVPLYKISSSKLRNNMVLNENQVKKNQIN